MDKEDGGGYNSIPITLVARHFTILFLRCVTAIYMKARILLIDLAYNGGSCPFSKLGLQTSLMAALGRVPGSAGRVSALLASPCAANFLKSSIAILSSAL